MYKKKMLKYLVAGTMVTSFSIIPATYANASEEDNVTEGIPVTETDVTEDDFKEIESVTGFTNQQLFDALEEEGYELTDIFTEEEIEYYKTQDKLRAGQTQWVGHKDGSATLYLSSAYTKTINVLGGGAVTVIGYLIKGSLGAGVGYFFDKMIDLNLDTTRGIYINFEQDPNHVFYPRNWGYQ